MMHIFSAKSKTKKKKIEPLEDAPILYIPLQQHIGKAAVPVVEIGETVKRFQLIGKASDYISANIHSPVSGTVKDLTWHSLADGSQVHVVVIENDFKNTELEHHDETDLEKLTASEILEMIKNAGIVGEGGAQFPTHVKYDIKDKKIDTFIVNGTECEPYLTNDYALMNEVSSRLFVGISIINNILKANKIVICIEEQNKELIFSFNMLMNKPEYSNIKIKILPNKYPQGGELQLIKSVTGKELKKGSLPAESGVIVSNVGTIISVYGAVVHGRPLVERVITVSGDNLQGAGNYIMKIGTPIKHIADALKVNTNPDTRLVVLGGPMMGKAVTNLMAPVMKGSSGILTFARKEDKRSNCISCGYCIDVCPMHLIPLKFEELYRKGRYDKLSEYNIVDCIECAACEYICPSDVPLIESIKNGKTKIMSSK
ncbi:MAG: electron transport complex subunit RsxC [Dysgonomonas sp.]